MLWVMGKAQIFGMIPWVPWLEQFQPKPKEHALKDIPMIVAQLIIQEWGVWNVNLLN